MTSSTYVSEADSYIIKAKTALQHRNRSNARRLVMQAIQINPNNVEAWIFLANISTPHGQIAYLEKALSINPNHNLAKKRLAQATFHNQSVLYEDLLSTYLQPKSKRVRINIDKGHKRKRKEENLIQTRSIGVALSLLLLLISIFTIWLSLATISHVFTNSSHSSRPEGLLQKPSITPTLTFTPTPTNTSSPTPTSTCTNTPTPTSTSTYTPTSTSTIISILSNTPTFPPATITSMPAIIDENDEKWIDVDLSEQLLSAYEGENITQSFIVSTGSVNTQTLPGNFRIYAMYESANFSGSDYYLPDVPYIMFYYKDFGIHGAYWHNDFGTPVSHGCVNMRVEDAKWLYEWATIGTIVIIHE